MSGVSKYFLQRQDSVLFFFLKHTSPLSPPQEMTYRYFELRKNADPEREDTPQFKSAFAVHPVSEPGLMYRLHKRFSQIELDWTYAQIQQLQVSPQRSLDHPPQHQEIKTFQNHCPHRLSETSLIRNVPQPPLSVPHQAKSTDTISCIEQLKFYSLLQCFTVSDQFIGVSVLAKMYRTCYCTFCTVPENRT